MIKHDWLCSIFAYKYRAATLTSPIQQWYQHTDRQYKARLHDHVMNRILAKAFESYGVMGSNVQRVTEMEYCKLMHNDVYRMTLNCIRWESKDSVQDWLVGLLVASWISDTFFEVKDDHY